MEIITLHLEDVTGSNSCNENAFILIRFEAHKRLNLPTIRAKLIKTPEAAISDYMGSSSPFKKA
jgi:hypothetical protein